MAHKSQHARRLIALVKAYIAVSGASVSPRAILRIVRLQGSILESEAGLRREARCVIKIGDEEWRQSRRVAERKGTSAVMSLTSRERAVMFAPSLDPPSHYINIFIKHQYSGIRILLFKRMARPGAINDHLPRADSSLPLSVG